MKKVCLFLAIILAGNYASAQTQMCEEMLNEGKKIYEQGNYSEARKYFERGTQICPDYKDEFQRWKERCDGQIRPRSQGSTTTVTTVTTLLMVSSQLSFGPLEEEQLFEVQSNVRYAIKKDISWCTTSITNGALLIKCSSNLEDSDREGTITVIANGKEVPVTIRQECVKVHLLPSSIADLSPAAGNVSIQVFSNVSWEPFSDAPWCSVMKTAGDLGFAAMFGENTSGTRKANIGVIAGGKKASIDILQHTTSLLRTENWLALVRKAVSTNTTKAYNEGKYKGDYTNNQREGLGCILWTNNAIYVGGWNAGNRQGQGIYMAPDNYIVPNCPDECQFYVGEWEQNEKSGMGNCYDEEGNLIYRSQFEFDVPNAKYPMENVNDYSKYKFQLIKYANGDIYLGETCEGRENGLGMVLYKNSDMWYGKWENGARAGYGIEIKSNGNTTTGTWTGNTYHSRQVKE